MGVSERSREQVEAYLAGLEETYGSFPVNQTTLSLPDERYASLRERETGIEAYIQVHNDDSEVLHVGRNGDRSLPGVRVTLDGGLERSVREQVREQAGIDCTVEELEQATIAGIRNADDRERDTLYLMIVVLNGSYVAGDLSDDAEWHSGTEDVRPIVA